MSDDRECEHVWVLAHVYPDYRLITLDPRFLEKAWRCSLCKGYVRTRPSQPPEDAAKLGRGKP
jgi:hypothetical protein